MAENKWVSGVISPNLKGPHNSTCNNRIGAHLVRLSQNSFAYFSQLKLLRIQQVCPKKGITGLPLHSYSVRMGLEPSILLYGNGFGFLGKRCLVSMAIVFFISRDNGGYIVPYKALFLGGGIGGSPYIDSHDFSFGQQKQPWWLLKLTRRDCVV